MIPHSRPWIGAAETDNLTAVLRSGMLIGGARPLEFKQTLAEVTGFAGAALFSSGRQAIAAALAALGLPLSSGVVVQTYVCDAVIWAIRAVGLRPVLCDIGCGWTASPETIAASIDDGCAALLLAPPFGFRQFAAPFRQFGLPIVHDLCQASPTVLARAPREDFGDVVTLSFHPTKYVCAGGGGAAIDLTGNYGDRLLSLEKLLGQVAPFTDLQAALGVAQLCRLDEFEARRASLFDLFLAHAPHSSTLRLRQQLDVVPGTMFRFPLDVDVTDAETLFAPLAEAGVAVRHGVDQLAHRLIGLADAAFPNAVAALRRTISWPFYPALSDAEAQQVACAMESLPR